MEMISSLLFVWDDKIFISFNVFTHLLLLRKRENQSVSLTTVIHLWKIKEVQLQRKSAGTEKSPLPYEGGVDISCILFLLQ